MTGPSAIGLALILLLPGCSLTVRIGPPPEKPEAVEDARFNLQMPSEVTTPCQQKPCEI